jgi:DNA mismatch endonuclease (patch repair protein)
VGFECRECLTVFWKLGTRVREGRSKSLLRWIKLNANEMLCKCPCVNTAMKDRLNRERRSWNMSRIRGKHTAPEMVVRSLLHRLGYRFRLHGKTLPGRPDVVLSKYKTVVFVHGCFWHRHKGCKNCTTPTNRREFWVAKLEGNAARDKLHRRALEKLGWRVFVVWECETEKSESLDRLRKVFLCALKPQNDRKKTTASLRIRVA